MKILFDQNISFRVVKSIHAKFPEAIHVKDLGMEHSSDRQIWTYAKSNNYSIITFDADFYDLATLLGHPPKIIWLRLGNTSTQHLVHFLNTRSEIIKSFLTNAEHTDMACLEISG